MEVVVVLDLTAQHLLQVVQVPVPVVIQVQMVPMEQPAPVAAVVVPVEDHPF